jgi:hypothetical protein
MDLLAYLYPYKFTLYEHNQNAIILKLLQSYLEQARL